MRRIAICLLLKVDAVSASVWILFSFEIVQRHAKFSQDCVAQLLQFSCRQHCDAFDCETLCATQALHSVPTACVAPWSAMIVQR